ncbi:hypothetical protein ABW20_dc0109779 [Dactylellina cionopaga]|nr:hypothetical protein ABW20_dc0109779 [Dactylellina cionopaga]
MSEDKDLTPNAAKKKLEALAHARVEGGPNVVWTGLKPRAESGPTKEEKGKGRQQCLRRRGPDGKISCAPRIKTPSKTTSISKPDGTFGEPVVTDAEGIPIDSGDLGDPEAISLENSDDLFWDKTTSTRPRRPISADVTVTNTLLVQVKPITYTTVTALPSMLSPSVEIWDDETLDPTPTEETTIINSTVREKSHPSSVEVITTPTLSETTSTQTPKPISSTPRAGQQGARVPEESSSVSLEASKSDKSSSIEQPEETAAARDRSKPNKHIRSTKDSGKKGDTNSQDTPVQAPQADSLKCYTIETKPNQYVDRGFAAGIVETFCSEFADGMNDAEFRGRGAWAKETPKGSGNEAIENVMVTGQDLNMMRISINWPTDNSPYSLTRDDCIFNLRDRLLDLCDTANNPLNFKAGGTAEYKGVKYSIDPLTVRTLKKDSLGFKCRWKRTTLVNIEDEHIYKVWGYGWAPSNEAQTILDRVFEPKGKCSKVIRVENNGFNRQRAELKYDADGDYDFAFRFGIQEKFNNCAGIELATIFAGLDRDSCTNPQPGEDDDLGM